MMIYDITLTITPEMVVWPGNPSVVLERVDRMEEGSNHNGSHISMRVHTGTHVDAPFHFLEDGKTIESLPLDVLMGEAQVVELDPSVDFITAETLLGAGLRPGVERVLFKTRNSQFWANRSEGFQTGFVGITADGAEYLIWQGVKLVGVDYLSVAPYKRSRETHQVFLKHQVVLLEGVDLSAVPAGKYRLYCLPLKLGGSDGAPARAVLVAED